MATVTFLINGEEIGNKAIMARVTIEEKADGSLFFKVKQTGNSKGQVHGVYFDVTDEAIRNTLRVNASASSDAQLNHAALGELKNGTDAIVTYDSNNTLPAVMGTDSHGYSFGLKSSARALRLSDFSQIKVDCAGSAQSFGEQRYDDNSYRWVYLTLQ